MRIANSHAIVTGGTRGIGLEISRELVRRGARLTIVARNPDLLASVGDELSAASVQADLSDMAQTGGVLARAEEAHGPVDLLVNNAGLLRPKPVAQMSAADMQAVLTTNLLAPVELCRGAMNSMIPRRTGALVNISSLAGEMALRNVGAYSTSKSALSHFTRIIQRELRGTGVRAHLVALGSVVTDMWEETYADPVAGPSAARLAAIPAPEATDVATRLADMVESGRRATLIMPAAGAPLHHLRQIPSRAADALMIGLPRSL